MSEQVQTILVVIVFGLVVGWLASLIVGGGSLIQYIVWGLLGAIVGGFLVPLLGINIDLGHPLVTKIAVSTIGAIIVVLIARLLA